MNEKGFYDIIKNFLVPSLYISFFGVLEYFNPMITSTIFGYENLKIDPNYSSAYLNRGVAKENLGDMKGACADWRKAAELGDEEAKKLVVMKRRQTTETAEDCARRWLVEDLAKAISRAVGLRSGPFAKISEVRNASF